MDTRLIWLCLQQLLATEFFFFIRLRPVMCTKCSSTYDSVVHGSLLLLYSLRSAGTWCQWRKIASCQLCILGPTYPPHLSAAETLSLYFSSSFTTKTRRKKCVVIHCQTIICSQFFAIAIIFQMINKNAFTLNETQKRVPFIAPSWGAKSSSTTTATIRLLCAERLKTKDTMGLFPFFFSVHEFFPKSFVFISPANIGIQIQSTQANGSDTFHMTHKCTCVCVQCQTFSCYEPIVAYSFHCVQYGLPRIGC